MCSILFIIKRHQHPDPIVEAMDNYHKFDPIEVREDWESWGALESKQEWIAQGNDPALWHGSTALLRITGTPKAKAEAMIQEDIINGIRRAKRKFGITVDLIPAIVKQTVATDGEFTTTAAAIKTYIRNKIDDSVYPGFD